MTDLQPYLHFGLNPSAQTKISLLLIWMFMWATSFALLRNLHSKAGFSSRDCIFSPQIFSASHAIKVSHSCETQWPILQSHPKKKKKAEKNPSQERWRWCIRSKAVSRREARDECSNNLFKIMVCTQFWGEISRRINHSTCSCLWNLFHVPEGFLTEATRPDIPSAPLRLLALSETWKCVRTKLQKHTHTHTQNALKSRRQVLNGLTELIRSHLGYTIKICNAAEPQPFTRHRLCFGNGISSLERNECANVPQVGFIIKQGAGTPVLTPDNSNVPRRQAGRQRWRRETQTCWPRHGDIGHKKALQLVTNGNLCKHVSHWDLEVVSTAQNASSNKGSCLGFSLFCRRRSRKLEGLTRLSFCLHLSDGIASFCQC